MNWYDWIIFIISNSFGFFIGTILGELTIRWWYKKRKIKMTNVDKLTLDCLLMDMEKIINCSDCKLCEEHDYNKWPSINIDWDSIPEWKDNNQNKE
ncbi:hypothetical protein [Spiroplasma ixodetis]|uniref:hypothetical protein n=1 Tax=Spiroplasma ixodetis TaxID=2141 RepID=UPI0025759EFF|nr:hypothetical protein [Spiroplasma ixodetis]WJG70369.1 hypothetical protein SIXOD_v1c14970 [Spiroplasma ixodetis Y32]